MRTPRLVTAVGLFLIGFLSPLECDDLRAQEAPPHPGALRVYLECHGWGCDQRQFRTDIDWVDWMRDPKDAQVHVIVTSQETGSGGRSYQLDFIGQGSLDGREDQLTYASLGTDVQDETVGGLARILALGLARFSVLAGAPTAFQVQSDNRGGATDRLVTEAEVDDPWDFWVFRVDLSTDLEGETSRTDTELDGSVEATRTTVGWKLAFEAGGEWRRSEIQLSDSTLVDTRREWQVDADAVYSLADHWSVGAQTRTSAATSTNENLSVSLAPALEYSVWPYEEAPRRSFRVRWTLGVRHFRYEEETIFGHTRETRPFEALQASLSQRQPWGNVYANVEASHYIHDLDRYRLSTGGYLSVRIVRGLNLRVDGRVSWIRDQLFLAAEGVSDEEILLQRRRLASNFDWNFGVGFSFQFGSIYNNVVNNRF